MPTSDYHQIPDVLHIVQVCDPRTILDVGVGFGKWGILCREVLEIYNGRVPSDVWVRTIDGSEIHEPYRNELWELAYDHVHIGNALEVLNSLQHYDLILCCDVIEHFEKADGLRLLRKLTEHGNVVVVTSPRGYQPQGPIYGNPFERHQSGWGLEDFHDFIHLYKEIGFTFMVVLAADENDLRGVQVIHPLQTMGVKKGAHELLKLAVSRARERMIGAAK